MQPNLRADRFAILKATAKCHQCRADTLVSALMVPAYKEFDEEWMESDDSALLIYVEAVDMSTQQAWSERAQWIRPVSSKTAGMTYWANVCACGALQGDFYLIKPNAPFFPLDDDGIAAIEIEWIESPIKAVAATSRSSWTDRLIEQCPHRGWTPPSPPKKRRIRGRI